MSDFNFACPVCHQHLKCDTSKSGSMMKCPTCFQRVVVPQAPNQDSKLVITAQRYVEQLSVADAVAASKSANNRPPTGLILVIIGFLGLAIGGYFVMRGLGSKQMLPLVNAGFETPTVADYNYAPDGTTANAGAFTSKNPPAPEGKQVAFLQSTGTFAQVVSGLIPGKRYTISFWAAQRIFINEIHPTQQPGQTWNVCVNGNVVGSFAPPTAATDYKKYSASFKAGMSPSTVAFVGTDLNGGDNTVFIDDVQITCP